MLVFGGTQNCLGMAHTSFISSWRSSMRHMERTKDAWPINHAGKFMREDYTTDTVCGTSSESPLWNKQESGSGVEIHQGINRNDVQNGTGCVTISAFRVSIGHCESYSPLEWQPRKQRYSTGMDCRRIGATMCKHFEIPIILHRSDEISLRVQVLSGSNGPVARIAIILSIQPFAHYLFQFSCQRVIPW